MTRTPIALRLSAQLLRGQRKRDPVSVVSHLLAVQGQDPRGARLAIRARSKGLSAADVDRALSEERSLLITWLNRGTLHLIASEDYPWLHALTAPRMRTPNLTRLGQLGVDPDTTERAVKTVARALEREGPLHRLELRDRLRQAGLQTDQALVHILIQVCIRGIAVRGPMKGGQHAYVRVEDWLGKTPKIEREAALAELARRFLIGHGPADAHDLARWSGLSLGDARAGLTAIASRLDHRQDGLLDIAGRAPAARPRGPLMLGAFDPVLHGWRSRAELLGGHAPQITVGGMFVPFVLARDRARAVWKILAGKVQVRELEPLSQDERTALDRESQDVLRYLKLGS